MVQAGTAQKRYLYHRKALPNMALEGMVQVVQKNPQIRCRTENGRCGEALG
jgi:hypothetical protein